MARRRSAPRQFSRTDRVSELVREIVASELERIGDERLELVTVTAVNVDSSLERAEVFYSALQAESEDRSAEVAEALEEVRWPIQTVVNKEVRARRTPQIRFRPDQVLSSALRIDEILRDLDGQGDGEPDAQPDGPGEITTEPSGTPEGDESNGSAGAPPA
jgi:ribosome-binding factor A